MVVLRVSSVKDVSEYDKVAVPDTSFYVALSCGYLWSSAALQVVLESGAKVVYPVTIRAEYEWLYENKTRDRFGALVAAMPSDDLFGEFNFRSFSISLDSVKDASSSYMAFAPKAAVSRANSIRRDVSVIMYALQLAKEKELVYVLTADSDIIFSLRELQRSTSLGNVRLLAPRESLEAGLGLAISKVEGGLDYLITNDAVPKILDAGRYGNYLVVSGRHVITDDISCNLGFDVIEKRMGFSYDLPEGVYLVPIFSVQPRHLKKSRIDPFQDFRSYDVCLFRNDFAGELSVVARGLQFSEGRLKETRVVHNVSLVKASHLNWQGRQDLDQKKKELAKAL